MTIEEATKLLKMSDQAIWLKGLEKEQRKAEDMAIKSLEAWGKVKNDICEIDWYGDDAFWDGVNLVSDIIDKHLAEVSE